MLDLDRVTPIDGIRYLIPPDDAVLEARDGNVRLPCGDIPIPLLIEDYDALDSPYPSYDAVGRGIYQALRINPDCAFAGRYARILKEAYPHYLSEIATNILILDRKDVEVPYLDRKVNLLKIFALIEPENRQFPLEIGLTLMDKGMRLSALHLSTVTLYKAEAFLRKALELSPEDPGILFHNGEISYILGRYDRAVSLWRAALQALQNEGIEGVQSRLEPAEAGAVPRVPVVDYLQAIGAAFQLFQGGEFEEAAAILVDVIDDRAFCRDFLMPEIHVVLGHCYEKLGAPKYAEECYSEALRLSSGCAEAREALAKLTAC